MTMQRISNSVSNLRAPIVAAAIGAGLCGTALVAVFVTAASSNSQGSSGSPALTRIEVTSMPGVGVLSERELVASAFAEHEAYMEGLFGPYVRSAWAPPVDLAFAREQHDRLIDAVIQP
jgi:hypothetical protein